jgi:AcrR family transcriptional regulator
MVAREANRRGEGEHLRAELVLAATDLLVAPQRATAPSLRAIARECGVSPSAVYLHFASQAELIGAVVDAQYDGLRAALALADRPRAAPLARLQALATAYVTWGIEHPGAYQLLFESADALPVVHEGSAVGTALMEQVEALVRAHGFRRGDEAVRRAQRAWVGMHGIVSLRIHKPQASWSATAQADAASLVTALMGETRAAPRRRDQAAL